jgi:hypothetical protein
MRHTSAALRREPPVCGADVSRFDAHPTSHSDSTSSRLETPGQLAGVSRSLFQRGRRRLRTTPQPIVSTRVDGSCPPQLPRDGGVTSDLRAVESKNTCDKALAMRFTASKRAVGTAFQTRAMIVWSASDGRADREESSVWRPGQWHAGISQQLVVSCAAGRLLLQTQRPAAEGPKNTRRPSADHRGLRSPPG